MWEQATESVFLSSVVIATFTIPILFFIHSLWIPRQNAAYNEWNAFKCTAHAHARASDACIIVHMGCGFCLRPRCKWQQRRPGSQDWQITISTLDDAFLSYCYFAATAMENECPCEQQIENEAKRTRQSLWPFQYFFKIVGRFQLFLPYEPRIHSNSYTSAG